MFQSLGFQIADGEVTDSNVGRQQHGQLRGYATSIGVVQHSANLSQYIYIYIYVWLLFSPSMQFCICDFPYIAIGEIPYKLRPLLKFSNIFVQLMQCSIWTNREHTKFIYLSTDPSVLQIWTEMQVVLDFGIIDQLHIISCAVSCFSFRIYLSLSLALNACFFFFFLCTLHLLHNSL